LHAEVGGARKTPVGGHGEAEGARKITAQMSGVHSRQGAVDDPLLIRSPHHLAIELRVSVVGVQIGSLEFESVLPERTGDPCGYLRQAAHQGEAVQLHRVRQGSFERIVARGAVKRDGLADEWPAQALPAPPQIEPWSAVNDSDGARSRSLCARGAVRQIDMLHGKDVLRERAVEFAIEGADMQPCGHYRAASGKA